MPTTLPSAQVERYTRDGFLSPNAALTREDAQRSLAKLEEFEKAVGGRLTADGTDPRYRARTHVLLAWVHALARHPAILGAVEDLIGPYILVYTSTWFIKEPETAAIAAWHQDATYFGLRPYVHVTAWLALTDATAENGCMEFLPGSHHLGQLPHRAGVVAGSVNRRPISRRRGERRAGGPRAAAGRRVLAAPHAAAPPLAAESVVRTADRSGDQLRPDARATSGRGAQDAGDAGPWSRYVRPLRARAAAVG